MKKLKFTIPVKVKRGLYEVNKVSVGSITNEGNIISMHGFDRIPRKLKKQAKSYKQMMFVFSKPTKDRKNALDFMWIETFKTVL